MRIEDLDLEIKRYRPAAGDVLVVKMDRLLTPQDKEDISRGFDALFGDTGVRILIAERGVTLEVFRCEANAALDERVGTGH